jgi:GR25 family glycosyltransferase involved in LPS biosynthesis
MSSNNFIEIAQIVQQLYTNQNYVSVKLLIANLFKSFMSKNIDEISSIIKEIKSHKLNNDCYRPLYNLFNMVYDPIIENGYKSLYTRNISNIEKAINHFNNPNKKLKKSVIIATTTCKRTDLLQKTVDSFLECVLDYTDYVQEWIIVDDNSSEQDRLLMKEKYPFITYIYKNSTEKGHPKSMNIIRDYVINKNVDYLFNLEDDWDFFMKDNYFEKMINIVNQNNHFGQCLININYSEDTKSGCQLWGADMHYTPQNERYFIHRHYTGKELENEVKSAGYSNCFYWPHFSFRPGITKVDVLKTLGNFNETAQHFEMDYAYRYVKLKYKTTFLDGIFCSHIGRRTYERNTNKLNAYDLNQEQQFGEKPKNQSSSLSSGPGHQKENIQNIRPEVSNEITDRISTEICCYLINLERRFDRLQNFFEQNKNELIPIQIFNGFDGKNISPSHKIQKAFKSGDYNYRRGIIGCAMSHISIWKKFLEEQTQNYVLVLEDDARLTRDFKNKLIYVLQENRGKFEIMFLHYNPYPNFMKLELNIQSSIPKAEEWSVERSMRENMGSGAGYILSRNGARNMLKHIQKHGVYNAIDWVMFKSPLDKRFTQRVMYTNPLLVQANCYQTSSGTDTDIQNVYTSLSFKDKWDWDIYEIKDLSDLLLKSTTSNDKKVVFMIDEELQSNQLYYNNILQIIDKDNIVKNPRKFLRIMFLLNPKQGYIKDCVCVIPIYNRSQNEVENIKTQLLNIINITPVEYYTTDNYIYTIPHLYMNDTFQKSKVWNADYLNTVLPF